MRKKGKGELSGPTYEGETITQLTCGVGWCKEPHASKTAGWRAIGGKRYLVWVWDAPCLDAVGTEAVGLLNRSLSKRKP